MGRNKIKRDCFFKPEFTNFKPSKINGFMQLNSDEIEALFLMDYQNLYQEDAAKKMNISRPTLSRIIKNARKKVATALILGYELEIVDDKDRFIVALSIKEKNNFQNVSNTNKLIALLHLENKKVLNIQYIKNPLFLKAEKPLEILPKILKKHKVHYWITDVLEDGLKNSLLAKGILVKNSKRFINENEIVKLFCCK